MLVIGELKYRLPLPQNGLSRPLLYAAIFISVMSTFTLAVAATPSPALPSPAQSDQAEPSSDIVVSGTRRLERTADQSLAPIDVVDSEALALTPSYDLTDRFAQTIPSFNLQRLPGVDGATFSRPASLRSLSPAETLVLVNG